MRLRLRLRLRLRVLSGQAARLGGLDHLRLVRRSDARAAAAPGEAVQRGHGREALVRVRVRIRVRVRVRIS